MITLMNFAPRDNLIILEYLVMLLKDSPSDDSIVLVDCPLTKYFL